MSDPGMELAKEGVKTAVSETIKPVTEMIGDVLGGLLGDRLRNWRRAKPAWQERNQRDTLEKAARISRDRGVNHAADEFNPTYVEEILEQAKDTNAEELQALFARLIAAAMDPERVSNYRREFAEVVKKMEPRDALVLRAYKKSHIKIQDSGLEYFYREFGIERDAIEVSGANLVRLNLMVSVSSIDRFQITSYGREFLSVIGD